MNADIIEYYHLARGVVGTSRYERMQYVQKWITKKYPNSGLNNKQMWLLIEELTNPLK